MDRQTDRRMDRQGRNQAYVCTQKRPHHFPKPEVSDETGALLVYSCFITYKSFSHRPTSMEHAELLDM